MASAMKEVVNKLNPARHGIKIITVFGATGNQGGSIIRHIQAHPKLSKEYTIRAITRDVSKPSSVALKEKGAEVVAADLNDEKSVFEAIKGSAVVFGVTNYWEKMSGDVEIKQGKNIVDAAKEAKVELLIWSSLPYVSKESNGTVTGVHHFDSKAQVEEYARALGVPASYFMPGFFMSGVSGGIRKDPEGNYTWHIPFGESTPLPMFAAAEDTGLFVAALLLSGEEMLGKRILGTSGWYTPLQVASEFEQATGQKLTLNKITYEQWAKALPLPPLAVEELVANFKLFENPGYFVGEPADAVDKDIALVAKLGLEPPTTFKQFLQKYPPQ